MSTDIWIVFGIAFTQLVITWYGVHVSVAEKRLRNAFIIGFLGAVGIALTVWGAIRNDRVQMALESQLTTIQHNTEKPQPPPVVNVNPPAISIQSVPAHSHVQFMPPNSSPNDPLFPLHEGQDLNLNVGFINAGDCSIDTDVYGAIVGVLPRSSTFDQQWRDLNRKIKFDVPAGGTLLPNKNGTTAIQYHTFYPDHHLTKSELDGLSSSPPTMRLCELAKIRWRDSTGTYETHSMQCLEHESDGSYNFHLGSQENVERRIAPAQ